ncbi:hypothetical protein EDM52_20295 [Brevibacillus invocatus]|uniref:Uncharacterized protein n=1 Tax=Brevibacillus invocatus TaxID=173959 RepID=A0A3M8C0N6_9BACL|nr:hypothetical protein [Brevibacillus invocatus]RNB68465.1 hypothetical protein EDM52_20295 [Brevibacillus invocatus]
MSRNWIVFLLHLVPFTYTGMAWDAYDHRLYGYFIAFILFCLLAYLQKSILLLFMGNLLSTGFSYVLAARYLLEYQHFFKPCGVIGTLIVESVIWFFLQLLIFCLARFRQE